MGHLSSFKCYWTTAISLHYWLQMAGPAEYSAKTVEAQMDVTRFVIGYKYYPKIWCLAAILNPNNI